MSEKKMYQVSTLQALALGYSRAVVTVGELLEHGDIGLGTFEDVNGEMIVVDGRCFRATEDGSVTEAPAEMGVPFAAVSRTTGARCLEVAGVDGVDALKTWLDLRVEEGFGLNSMHIVRIDGRFPLVRARSESAYRSQHISLKEILSTTQKDFHFEDVTGTLVCVYFPDYMDGINAPGWHFHFLSEDKTRGGHVFELVMEQGKVRLAKINRIEIQLPREAAFDTYSLKNASEDEIKQVEQGK
jgi:acetolactate decarboxylase